MIFKCDQFRSAKFKNSVDYWVPLIAIHTGAILDKICHIYAAGICNVDGIDVISINDDGDFKRLNNENGRPCQVPIHPNRIKLDFLSLIDARRKNSSQRLFPEAERNGEDKYDSIGKRFATLKKSCGVIGAPHEKTFHSFSTMVSLELIRRLGAPEGLVNDIIDHASEYRESETKKNYGEGVTIPQVTYPCVKNFNFNFPKNGVNSCL